MAQSSGMNAVDLAVIGVILLSGGLALWRGFVRELLSLAAWIGASLIAVYFYPSLQPWMHRHIHTEITADACTGLALFCGSLAVLIPIGYFVGGLIRGRALTAIDRSLGFVFGLARGVLVVCLLFLITLWVWPEEKKEPDMLAHAKSRPMMVAGAEVIKNLLPAEQVKKISDDAHAITKKIDDESDKALAGAAGDTTSAKQVTDPAGKTPTQDSAASVIENLIKQPVGAQ